MRCAAHGGTLPRRACWQIRLARCNLTVAAVAVLGPAVAIAIYAATRDQPLIQGDRLADQPLPSQAVAGSDTDFAWLSAAMKKLADDRPPASRTRCISLSSRSVYQPKDADQLGAGPRCNCIGNALVLPGDDTISGLRSKSLSVALGEYVFSIRDEQTQKDGPQMAAGDRRKVAVDCRRQGVTSLRMQFRPRAYRGNDDAWGNVIAHRRGNCYWINAIYEYPSTNASGRATCSSGFRSAGTQNTAAITPAATIKPAPSR